MERSSSPQEITRLLREWRHGSEAAEAELWPILYGELRSLARGVLRGQGGWRRLGTTTLVHEAYLRLVGSAPGIEWNDRGHFFAVAARAMRFILVDEARRQLSQKRGGDLPPVGGDSEPLEPADPAAHRPEDVLAIHQALERLARIHPRYEKLVEMRYFAGLSVDETAEALGVSRPTIVRDWQSARTWLYGELRS
jgi:RNA polymerase sigma factor (TIGR02999 family)